MKTTILYHASCNDGFSAALAAWLFFKEEALYIPVSYGKEPPPIDPCDRLYLLDFSYSREQLNTLNEEKADQIVILDHHKTAEADLKTFSSLQQLHEEPDQRGIFVHFDMNESGGSLAWRLFHPEKVLPVLFEMTKDRDLWLWKRPHSKEYNAALFSYPYDFTLWQRFVTDPYATNELISDGAAILRAQRQRVETLCRSPRWITLAGEKAPCVNATSDISEVGEYLCEHYPDAPFSVSYCVREKDTVSWSLRSRNGYDVSVVARCFHGGGHKAAAGFVTTGEEMMRILLGIDPWETQGGPDV